MRGEVTRPAVLLGLALLLSSLVPRAEACARLPEDWTSKERLADAYADATTIVVARLTHSSRTSSVGNRRDIGIVEDAWFVVVEVLKGPHEVGETIHTRTEFEPGPCGTNVLNDPPWIHQAGTKDFVPLALSDTWLIFGGEQQPYDLSLGRSSPMNVHGDTARKTLKAILEQTEATASATLREFRKALHEARSAATNASLVCPSMLSELVGLSKSSLLSELASPDLHEDAFSQDSGSVVVTHYMHYYLRPLQAKVSDEHFPIVTFELTSSNVVRAVSCK